MMIFRSVLVCLRLPENPKMLDFINYTVARRGVCDSRGFSWGESEVHTESKSTLPDLTLYNVFILWLQKSEYGLQKLSMTEKNEYVLQKVSMNCKKWIRISDSLFVIWKKCEPIQSLGNWLGPPDPANFG